MASRFLMQIVDKQTGNTIQFEPGRNVETDFVSDCVANIVKRGVGLGRTTKHVTQDIEDGIKEAIFNLKLKVKG